MVAVTMSETMDIETGVERFYRWQKRKKSESTANRYRNSLRKWADWLSENRDKTMFEANENDLQEYVFDLQDEGYAPDTIKVRRAAASQFYQTMERKRTGGATFPESIIDDEGEVDNVAEDVNLNGSYHKSGTLKSQHSREDIFYLEPEEIEQLKEHVPAPEVRNELIIMMLYQTGMRRGELARVRLKDIDRDERRIQVRNQKGQSNRTVWYQSSLDTNLSIWLGSERDAVLTASESEYLFPSKMSERISDWSVSQVVRQAAENAGLQETLYVDQRGREQVKITAHTLRHSFANRLVTGEDSIDLARLQDLMGHEDIETTRIYLKFKETHLRACPTVGAPPSRHKRRSEPQFYFVS
jgi:integrase/recombinase XerD